MLRPSLHALARRPLLSGAIIATLALAFAATLLVLGLLDSYLLRPLPYGDAARLVVINEYPLSTGPAGNAWRMTFGNAADIYDQSTAFSRTAIVRNEGFTVHTPGGAENAFVQRVTPEFFPMLGLRAAHGDIITPANAELGGERALLLSHDFWSRRFGADPAIVGKNVRLDNASYRVVGVLPANTVLPVVGEGQQGWVAMLPTDFVRTDRTVRRQFMLAELAPSRSLASAQGELAALARRLAQDFPATNADRGLTAIDLRSALVGNFRQQLVLLQLAVGLVLVVACVNAGSLLLAQAIRRRREFAVRLALGAGTRDLLRQFFLESLWLALAGAAFGLMLAAWLAPLTRELLPASSSLNQIPPPAISSTVVACAALLALAIATVFSLVPLVQARRLKIEAALRDGSRQLGSVSGGAATRLLVSLQVAVALALLITAVQLVRSFRAVQTIDRGFAAEQTYSFRLGTRGPSYQELDARVRYFRGVADRLKELPHVAAVGVQDFGFVNVPGSYFSFAQEGDGLQLSETPKRAARLFVSPELREVYQFQLLAGRWLSDSDRSDTPRVAVVSENLAAKHWPGEDPIGKRVRIENTGDEWWTVVGVVENIISSGSQPQPIDAFYLPDTQHAPFDVAVFVRVHGTQPLTKDQVDRAVALTDATNSAYFFHHVARFYADSAWQTRFGLTLVLAFAGLAVVLCLTGVYAVLAFAVAGRTAEFGVRLALGASPRAVAQLVVRDAARMTVPGLVVGTVLAFASARLVSHLLFGVSPLDPLSYGLTVIALGTACAVACAVPSWRAARVDPLVALRTD